MSDTPRTDLAYKNSTGAGIYQLFKEAQEIERELNAANAKIQRLVEAGDAIVENGSVSERLERDWTKAKEGL